LLGRMCVTMEIPVMRRLALRKLRAQRALREFLFPGRVARRALTALRLSGSVALACCLAAEPSRSIERIYIEMFATKAGAEQLQQDVAAEIRKLSSVVIVPDRARADAILGGGGEIWIKGHRSLNPRSGRLPSNGSPVYGGFLSVELKD